MQTFYFAKGKYMVDGESRMNRLEGFSNVQPYEYEVQICESKSPIPPYRHKLTYGELSAIAESEEGWAFYIHQDGKQPETLLAVSRDYEKCHYYCSEQEVTTAQRDQALIHMRTVYDGVLPTHGGSVIHASCIKHQGQAVMFCAPSQTGKSTQAKLWAGRFGAKIISSDAPAVFPEKNGAAAYGMPWDGSDQIMVQDQAPVAAIIELRQAKRNRIQRLTHRQAFRMLMKQGHLPMWDEEAMEKEMLVLKILSGKVPFYRLYCLPDEGAAELVEEVVFGGKTDKIIMEETEMKVKEGFVLREVVDEYLVMPAGAQMKSFEGAVVLNEPSAFLWNKMQSNVTRTELVEALLAEYDVDEETARQDTDALIEKLDAYGVLDHVE